MYQKNHQLFSKLFGCLLIVIIIQSCGPATPGIWKNDKIAEGKRNTLHALNAEMLQYLKANRYQALQMMLSKGLLDDPDMIRTVEEASIYMKQGSFKLLREYYVAGPVETKVTISERGLGINDFDLFYKSGADEMYVVFFVQQKLADRHIIAAFYDKLDYGWKLSHMEINQYTVSGKTAPELYTLAAEQRRKGYLFDALNTMSLATQCMQPCFGWYYTKNSEITNFHQALADTINYKYHFPVDISQIATHPQIIRVANQKTPEGQFPKIYYVSKIKLQDTLAIKKENQQIKQVIGTLMPGINKDKKYVLYAAFNQRPSAKIAAEHFDMTDKLQ